MYLAEGIPKQPHGRWKATEFKRQRFQEAYFDILCHTFAHSLKVYMQLGRRVWRLKDDILYKYAY
jgi:hypothetical protein